MNKAEFVKILSEELDVTKKRAEEVIKGYDQAVLKAGREIEVGDKIPVSSLFKVEKVHRDEREGRNPHTGDLIIIPAKDVLKLRPLKALKECLL